MVKLVSFARNGAETETIQNRNDVLFQTLTWKLNSKLPPNENLTTVTI